VRVDKLETDGPGVKAIHPYQRGLPRVCECCEQELSAAVRYERDTTCLHSSRALLGDGRTAAHVAAPSTVRYDVTRLHGCTLRPFRGRTVMLQKRG